MAIKTDAMVAHGGADGYTLHIDYDPDTDAYQLKIVSNDGTVKENDDIAGISLFTQRISGTLSGDIKSNVTALAPYALADTSITSMDIPECTAIYRYAFLNCTSLISLNTPKAANISSAFEGCSALRTAIFPSAVTVGTAFKNCTALEYVYIGSGCTSIGATCFTGCDSITIDCGFSSTAAASAGAPWGATNATVNYDVAEPNPPVLSGLRITPNPGLIQNSDFDLFDDIHPVVEVKKTKRSAK